jgi:hypothetical protein
VTGSCEHDSHGCGTSSSIKGGVFLNWLRELASQEGICCSYKPAENACCRSKIRCSNQQIEVHFFS